MERKGTNEVVLQISVPEDSKRVSSMAEAGSYTSPKNLELTQLESLRIRISTPTPIPSPATEIVSMSSTPNRLPKILNENNLTPRKSLARSAFSKPKSRLVEPSYLNDATMVEQNKTQILNPCSSPLISPGVREEDEEEVYKTDDLRVSEKPEILRSDLRGVFSSVHPPSSIGPLVMEIAEDVRSGTSIC